MEVGTVPGEDKDCLEGMVARFSKKRKKKTGYRRLGY